MSESSRTVEGALGDQLRSWHTRTGLTAGMYIAEALRDAGWTVAQGARVSREATGEHSMVDIVARFREWDGCIELVLVVECLGTEGSPWVAPCGPPLPYAFEYEVDRHAAPGLGRSCLAAAVSGVLEVPNQLLFSHLRIEEELAYGLHTAPADAREHGHRSPEDAMRRTALAASMISEKATANAFNEELRSFSSQPIALAMQVIVCDGMLLSSSLAADRVEFHEKEVLKLLLEDVTNEEKSVLVTLVTRDAFRGWLKALTRGMRRLLPVIGRDFDPIARYHSATLRPGSA